MSLADIPPDMALLILGTFITITILNWFYDRNE